MRIGWIIASLALAAGCADVHPDGDAADLPDASFAALKADGDALTAAEALAVLEIANTGTEALLDDDVRLDRRAAQLIVTRRAGPDGRDGTADDAPFTDLDELDAVPYVGPIALSRLLAWAHAEGLVDRHSEPADAGCLLITEYVEGQGMNNKAVEIMNCAGAPVELGAYAICLIRNDARVCSVTARLGDRRLAPGDVTTLCRTTEGTLNDPMTPIATRCETAVPGMTFDGDDRLLVFRADDGRVMDMLGRPGFRPYWRPWEDVVLRRCDASPVTDTGAFYDERLHFTEHPRGDLSDFGKPPALTGCP